MTCVVGLEAAGGRVYIGGDSALTADSLSIMRRPKVWTRGELAVGYAGSLRVGNVLEAAELPAYAGGCSFRFMVAELVPVLLAALEAVDLSLEDQELLIGVGGVLYCVDSEAGVHGYACGYGAIGDGAAAALGAMFTGAGVDPGLRVRGALAAAEAHCPTVRGPFYVVSV